MKRLPERLINKGALQFKTSCNSYTCRGQYGCPKLKKKKVFLVIQNGAEDFFTSTPARGTPYVVQ